jgi:hypothetical protein
VHARTEDIGGGAGLAFKRLKSHGSYGLGESYWLGLERVTTVMGDGLAVRKRRGG